MSAAHLTEYPINIPTHRPEITPPSAYQIIARRLTFACVDELSNYTLHAPPDQIKRGQIAIQSQNPIDSFACNSALIWGLLIMNSEITFKGFCSLQILTFNQPSIQKHVCICGQTFQSSLFWILRTRVSCLKVLKKQKVLLVEIKRFNTSVRRVFCWIPSINRGTRTGQRRWWRSEDFPKTMAVITSRYRDYRPARVPAVTTARKFINLTINKLWYL